MAPDFVLDEIEGLDSFHFHNLALAADLALTVYQVRLGSHSIS